MNNIGDRLIKIIDERIEKKMMQFNFINKYTGIVKSVDENTGKATITIAGYDTEFTFLNKTGENLSIGDGVKIECVNNNITNGFISERLGAANLTGGLKVYYNTTIPSNDEGEDGDFCIVY